MMRRLCYVNLINESHSIIYDGLVEKRKDNTQDEYNKRNSFIKIRRLKFCFHIGSVFNIKQYR